MQQSNLLTSHKKQPQKDNISSILMRSPSPTKKFDAESDNESVTKLSLKMRAMTS